MSVAIPTKTLNVTCVLLVTGEKPVKYVPVDQDCKHVVVWPMVNVLKELTEMALVIVDSRQNRRGCWRLTLNAIPMNQWVSTPMNPMLLAPNVPLISLVNIV